MLYVNIKRCMSTLCQQLIALLYVNSPDQLYVSIVKALCQYLLMLKQLMIYVNS